MAGNLADDRDERGPDQGPDAGLGYHARGTERTSATGFLLDALRRRPIGHAVLHALTAVLFLAGAGMFSYPFFTDVYTEQVIQQRLEDEFVQLEVQTFDEWETSVRGQTGTALTKIVIPELDVETLVVEGTSPAALRAGAGHYPNTPLPGQVGNVAIAGHRTTYGRPFNRVDELEPGDVIWLITPVGDHRYVVSDTPEGWTANPYVTGPKDWQVIAPTPDATLTLTTCHPKGSADKRLIVRAQLAESHPPGTWSEPSA
jgi:sortase A